MHVKLKSLSKNQDFKFILNGKKTSNKYSTIFYRRLDSKSNKNFNISFITKKKIGNAVIRNKIKRRLRNMMNEFLKKISINLNYSYLLIARRTILEYEYNFENHAHHHAEAFKALAEHPDQHLGWLSMDGECFSVRERSPFKNDFPTVMLEQTKNYYRMAAQWAEIMATKHLRAARRLNHSVDQYVFEATINRIARDREEEFAIFTASLLSCFLPQQVSWREQIYLEI